MWFGHKGRVPSSTLAITTVDGTIIQQVTVSNYLGIWLDIALMPIRYNQRSKQDLIFFREVVPNLNLLPSLFEKTILPLWGQFWCKSKTFVANPKILFETLIGLFANLKLLFGPKLERCKRTVSWPVPSEATAPQWTHQPQNSEAGAENTD